ATDGLIPAPNVVLPAFTGGGQFGVPVDAVHAVQRGGGHVRLWPDAEDRLDGALGGGATTDDRDTTDPTQRPHAGPALHELAEGEDGGAVGEVLVVGVAESAGVDHPAGGYRAATGELDLDRRAVAGHRLDVGVGD